jgi:hypothetical protein
MILFWITKLLIHLDWVSRLWEDRPRHAGHFCLTVGLVVQFRLMCGGRSSRCAAQATTKHCLFMCTTSARTDEVPMMIRLLAAGPAYSYRWTNRVSQH